MSASKVKSNHKRSTLGSEFLGEEPQKEGLDMKSMVDQIVFHLIDRNKCDLQDDYRSHGMVGVFGHWGTGKTHILNLIGEKLGKRAGKKPDSYVCVFRAWEYEAEVDLAAAFIRALVNKDNYPWGQEAPDFQKVLPSGTTLRQAAWKFADFVFSMGSASKNPAISIAGEIGKILLDLKDSEKSVPPEPIADQVRNAMHEMINRILPPEGHLYVLVDDLDRCAPPNIVRLFEWFKNHLDSTRCTYVLGLDHRIAAKAIVGHYKDHISLTKQESIDYGYRYLDKLFEVEYEILPSHLAEKMVLERLKIKEYSIAEWTHSKIGRDFGGESDLKSLLERSALWVPRVLLRTVQTYRMALEALVEQNRNDEGALFSNHLPSSFPFWLFLLSALHHLFPPDEVESFVREDLQERQRDNDTAGMGSVLNPIDREKNQQYTNIDPRKDFIDQIGRIKSAVLSIDQMRYLYQTVREKAPRPYSSNTY